MNETKIALRVATGLRMSPRQTALLLSRTERQARRRDFRLFMGVGDTFRITAGDRDFMNPQPYYFGEKRPRRRGQRKFEGWGNFAYNTGRLGL